MAFPARYKGTCSKCNTAIEPGQFITWSRREKGKASHFDCANPSAIPAEPRGTPNMEPDKPNDAFNTPKPDYAEEVQKAYETPRTEKAKADSLGEVLARNVAPYLNQMLATKVDEKRVRAIVDAAISEQTVTTIRVESPDGEAKEIKSAHECMAKLLYLIQKRHHAYLWGGPGSGKSTAAAQVAESLGIPYGYISLNPQTPDSRLLGFIDAGGTYRDTVFYRTFKDGGVFCIDEIDNASPSLLTTLNGALENGHAAFPCGMVERHPDFVVIATGNTCGKGANPQFPERRPFDAAFSERFTFLRWDYDAKLERAITLGINPGAEDWLKWVKDARKHCAEHYPRVLVSPRAAFKGAEYLKDSTLSVADIAESVVFKGTDADTVKAILTAVPLPEKAEVEAL